MTAKCFISHSLGSNKTYIRRLRSARFLFSFSSNFSGNQRWIKLLWLWIGWLGKLAYNMTTTILSGLWLVMWVFPFTFRRCCRVKNVTDLVFAFESCWDDDDFWQLLIMRRNAEDFALSHACRGGWLRGKFPWVVSDIVGRAFQLKLRRNLDGIPWETDSAAIESQALRCACEKARFVREPNKVARERLGSLHSPEKRVQMRAPIIYSIKNL